MAQRLGDQRRWGELATLQAQVLYHQGEFERLAAGEAEMHARISHADDPQQKAHVLLGEVWFLMPQGQLDTVVTRLEEVLRLLAGRGSRADEILAHGQLAVAYLRRGDRELARVAARQAASLTAQSLPVAVHILEGYAGVAEVYMDLWVAGDRAAARPARQARATLGRFARAFPMARPRAWLYEGRAAHHLGRQRHALAVWHKSLRMAERLVMPYEQGRAHYELGRHLPPGRPARQAHLTRAGEIFADIGALYELDHVRTATSR